MDFAHRDKAGNMELNRGRWWLVIVTSSGRDKQMVTLMATIYTCEACGYVGAPFAQKRGD